jgi:hypothetical protein
MRLLVFVCGDVVYGVLSVRLIKKLDPSTPQTHLSEDAMVEPSVDPDRRRSA